MAKGKDVHILNFDEYLRQGEPGKKEKAEIWRTAIGLQDVDGLKTSDYLKQTAKRNIEGDITIDQVQKLITSYYNARENRNADSGQIEADKASANIAKILKEKTFAFSLPGFVSIHKRIFEGVFKFAGRIRDYNITKQEWVLEGDTVLYVPATDIKRAVEYDLQQEIFQLCPPGYQSDNLSSGQVHFRSVADSSFRGRQHQGYCRIRDKVSAITGIPGKQRNVCKAFLVFP